MQVRAKFVVQSITVTKHWERGKGNISTVKLIPVMGGSEENREFFVASPSGQIELGMVNQAAAEAFELGAEYYVDFTKA